MSDADRNLIQKMGIKPRCPICHAFYYGNNVRLLAEKRGRYLFHIECPSCHSCIINITVDSLIGISSLYMVTDFRQEDLAKILFHGSPVTCDEVIEVYEELSHKPSSNK